MSQRLLVTLAMFAAAAGCAAHEDPDVQAPAPEVVNPDPVEVPEEVPPIALKVAVVSISSVQLNENCPDPPDERPAASPPAKPLEAPAGDVSAAEPRPARAKRGRRRGGAPLVQPCTQSTMQLAFLGQGPKSAKAVIKEVRLVDPKSSKTLGQIEARKPTSWVESGGYQAWDGTLAAHSDLKASYKLGEPGWSAVEKTLGAGSYGPMFVLEVDIDIGGVLQTARSPEFARERPHRIVT